MEKTVLILLVAFAALSLGHWWAVAQFISTYGTWYLIVFALLQLSLVGSFFQAERTLANEFGSQHQAVGTGKLLLPTFLISICLLSAFVAAHNLIVLGWQMNLFFVILTEPYQPGDFALLVNQQGRLIDGLFDQILWLVVATTLFVFVCYSLFGHYRRQLAPLLVVLSLCAFLVFFMLYFWQHDASMIAEIPDQHSDLSELLSRSASVALETSLAGLGVFFTLRFIARKNLAQSFLGFSMIIALFLSAGLAVAGWLMIISTGDDLFAASDKLLILAPLYIQSLVTGKFILLLWIISTVTLILIKTALLSGVCLYAFSRYLLPGFEENKLLVPGCISLLAFLWLIISALTGLLSDQDSTALFRDVFIDFFTYWTPLQLAFICLLAFLQPALAHSNVLPIAFISLSEVVRWYYLALAVGCLLFFVYRNYPQVL